MSTRNYVAFESGKYKQRPSNLDTVDFVGVRIGASNLPITESSGHFDFAGYRLKNIGTPSLGTDAATKAYVDSLSSGLDPKQAALAATTADLNAAYNNGTGGVGATLTYNVSGAIVVDDVNLTVNDRVLVKDQTNAEENGVYYVSTSGDISTPWVLTRAVDFDGSPTGEVNGGEYLFVIAGTTNADYGYVVSSPDTTAIIGTTNIVFTQFSSVVVPTATSAPGGGTQGKVSADEDKGLKIVGGVMEVKRDTAGAIAVTTGGTGGLKINLEASNPSLQISGNELGVKFGDTTLAKNSSGTYVKFSETLTNDNAGTINARDIVYVKSNGNVDLAQANGSYTPGTQFGMVSDATIAAAASGLVYLRPGAKVSGFSGLTIGSPVYLSRSVAGGYQQDLTGFVAGEHVVRIGYALTASVVQFQPEYVIEY